MRGEMILVATAHLIYKTFFLNNLTTVQLMQRQPSHRTFRRPTLPE